MSILIDFCRFLDSSVTFTIGRKIDFWTVPLPLQLAEKLIFWPVLAKFGRICPFLSVFDRFDHFCPILADFVRFSFTFDVNFAILGRFWPKSIHFILNFSKGLNILGCLLPKPRIWPSCILYLKSSQAQLTRHHLFSFWKKRHFKNTDLFLSFPRFRNLLRF